MHLKQTKKGSRKTGGPQYYIHDLTEPVKIYLRKKGAVRVALITPYGATETKYFAVSADHKLDKNKKVVKGKVGHDRIQQGYARESIGESIRRWYALKKGDFDYIEVDIDIVDDIFHIRPLKVKYVNSKRSVSLPITDRPLTFTKNYVSTLWDKQIQKLQKRQRCKLSWALNEICRIIEAHRFKRSNVSEEDILRASGPLKCLGLMLGPHLRRGYDCPDSWFKFLKYPEYPVPIEIKRESKDFRYQQKKYSKDQLSRVVILCVHHNLKHVPLNVDVIELSALCQWGSKL